MFTKAHSASLATTTQLCLHVIRHHHALVSLTTATQSCLQLTLLYIQSFQKQAYATQLLMLSDDVHFPSLQTSHNECDMNYLLWEATKH